MFDKNYSKIVSLNIIFLTDFSLYNLFLFLYIKERYTFFQFIFSIDFLIKLKIKKNDSLQNIMSFEIMFTYLFQSYQ